MGRHVFLFAGGEELTTMGAVWFVSYCYYNNVDKNHLNWKKISTYKNRSSVYVRTKKYYKFWLEKVLEMDDNNLAKNMIELKPFQVKKMARQILDTL